MRLVLLAVMAVLLAPGLAVAEDGDIALGRDLLGKDCVGRLRGPASADPRVPPPMDIHCGGAALPGGRVRADWSEAAQDSAQTIRMIGDSPLVADISLRLSCPPGLWAEGGDPADLLIAHCATREGNWPAVMLGALRGRLLLLAEGMAASQPVLEAAMARMAPAQAGEAAAPPRPRPTATLVDPGLAASYRDLTEQARLNNGMGNHAGAEQAYRRALDVQRKAFGPDDPGLGDTLMHLALEVSNQGRFVEAGELFRRAEPLVRRSVIPLDLPRLLSYQALDAANRHSYAEARSLAREATIARQAVVAGDGGTGGGAKGGMMDGFLARGEQAQSLLLEAAMALKLSDFATAEIAASEALAITDKVAGLPGGWKVQALTALGEAYGHLGRAAEGEPLLKEAVSLSQRQFGGGIPYILTLAALGRFQAEQGRYPEAMDAFRKAFSLLISNPPEGLRLGFEAVAPFIATAMELAEQAKDDRIGILDQVFSVMQMVQASQQSDTVSHAALKFASGDERIAKMVAERQDAQRRRDEIRLSLATEAARPAEQRDLEREGWLADQYGAAVTRMAELDAQLRADFPEYARLANPPPVTIARLRTVLAPGEGVIAFSFGDEFGLAVAVTADEVRASRLEVGKAELASDVADLRKGITVRDGRVGRYDLMLAHSLYRKLFAPLGNILQSTRHLMVVPAGALASLPPAALVVSPPASPEPGQADWLARHAALSQWPSVGALVAMRRHAGVSVASQPVLGVGNPRFAGLSRAATAAATPLADHCRTDGPLPPELLGQLVPLPDTATELSAVGRVLKARPGDILLDVSATEPALRGKALDQYRVLYFATHGLLPQELRCQSEPGLALAPPASPAAGKAEDGLLEASEIAALRLDADLVVLSACNTASAGNRFGGEALSSLADVFFHAGARSVLASHWPVPSASTTRLMTGVFERNAQAGLGFDAALQQSQLALLADRTTAHPVHWAGFTLIGGTTKGASP